jgi:hypothetical protein
MDDFPIKPALVIKDKPKPRRIASLRAARIYVDESLRLGRPPPWRDLAHRLKLVASPEDVVEAIDALRELVAAEDLLVEPNLPLVTRPNPHKKSDGD